MQLTTNPSPLLLGCVADDFTGAGDAASFLAGQGLKTLLFNGVPQCDALPEDCSAVVIATKTRSIAPCDAADEAERAFRWLRQMGARQFYFKYCSTFDSTPQGNIGPVADRVLSLLDEKFTLLCPSLPVNGRTVEDGVLYVNGVPLDESPMRDHPLNPMWDARIPRLMRPQSQNSCMVLGRTELSLPDEAVLSLLNAFGREREHFYIVPDYCTAQDEERIMHLFGDCRLLTGGSGLLSPMADHLRRMYGLPVCPAPDAGVPGPAVLLAGSCSTATRGQIARYCQQGPAFPVEASRLISGSETAGTLWETAGSRADAAPLFYSAGAVDPVLRLQESPAQKAAAAAAMEQTMAGLARLAYDAGVKRFLVAGGETAGAVAQELGFDAYLISECVAPGVPVMVPLHDKSIRVVYKSGNFGTEDFFSRALHLTGV